MIVFLHVPKTGGRAFEAFLRMNLATVLRLDWEPPDDETREKVQEADAVAGHFDFTFCKYFPDNARWYTILRDPIERLNSLYWWCYRHTPHHIHQHALKGEVHFAKLSWHEVDNNFVRVYSGQPQQDMSIVVDDTMLTQAKANLEKHFSVGFFDRLNDYARSVAQENEWLVHYLPLWGDGRNTRRISDQALNILKERNWADIELYQWALKKFGK